MERLSNYFISEAQKDERLAGVPKDHIPLTLQLVANIVISTGDLQSRGLNKHSQIARDYLYAESHECTYYSRLCMSTAKLTASGRRALVSTSNRSLADYGVLSIDHPCADDVVKPLNDEATITYTTAISPKLRRELDLAPMAFIRHKVGFGQFSDMKRHLRNVCDKKRKMWKCNDCGIVDENQTKIRKHCSDFKHGGVTDDLISKRIYSCSFCEKCWTELEKFISCVKNDQSKHPELCPMPSKGVRGLMAQTKVTRDLMARACEKRGLARDAWTVSLWDDDTCALVCRKLEYSWNDKSFTYDIDGKDFDFIVDRLMSSTTFETTTLPMPSSEVPGNPSYSAMRRSESHDHHDGLLPHSAETHASMDLLQAENPAYDSSASSDIRQPHQRNNHLAGLPVPTKRQLSLASFDHPDGSSRTKRVVPVQNPAVSNWPFERTAPQAVQALHHPMHATQTVNDEPVPSGDVQQATVSTAPVGSLTGGYNYYGDDVTGPNFQDEFAGWPYTHQGSPPFPGFDEN
ncbi:hypothetical protein LTR09_008370 [Extremus antarcticus]|uniref:Uncharacterized protein n=1 Tax=Extremus antarcticus TaxID=702011 RepID=A0AAJ0DB62_9PEZI|nr:hypothetical protein LTR09_008370 [Extremus antarcticus]